MVIVVIWPKSMCPSVITVVIGYKNTFDSSENVLTVYPISTVQLSFTVILCIRYVYFNFH